MCVIMMMLFVQNLMTGHAIDNSINRQQSLCLELTKAHSIKAKFWSTEPQTAKGPRYTSVVQALHPKRGLAMCVVGNRGKRALRG